MAVYRATAAIGRKSWTSPLLRKVLDRVCSRSHCEVKAHGAKQPVVRCCASPLWRNTQLERSEFLAGGCRHSYFGLKRTKREGLDWLKVLRDDREQPVGAHRLRDVAVHAKPLAAVIP